MVFWKKRTVNSPTQEASADDALDVEQAVLIRITSLTDPDSGLDLIEDPIIDAIETAGVGEFDGNEIGAEGATLFMYGPDADALWDAVDSVVSRSALGPGSHAVKRYGLPGAREVRVELA
jgi:hypothetical protein